MNFNDYLNKEIYGTNTGILRKLYLKYISPQTNAVFLIRSFQKYCSKKDGLSNIISEYYRLKLIKKYNIYIGRNTKIGPGLDLPHPNGIVFGDGVVIGQNVVIYQQVTFGGARRGDFLLGNYPKIEDNCIFFSGAKIIGNIKVGSNVVVGANCVLNIDADPGSTYVGIPGKKLIK